MAINVSRLRAAGLAKESTIGTVVITPTRFLNIVPPDSFTPAIEPLPSKGIEALADMFPKITQGPATLNGMKVKLEAEPENLGELFQALFGLDTQAEVASFVVTMGVNDSIDFKENGGSALHGVLTPGTYIAGTTSATDGTLCEEIKDALEGASGATLTYTVTYSYSTRKFTITASSTTIQILWLTGANNATNAHTLLGFSKTDTSASLALTSDQTTQVPPFSHTYTRQQVAQLPTYTWWFDKKPKYQLIGGCMLDKLDLTMKAKGLLECDTDWVGTVYDDTDGVTEAATFSTLNPFTFAQVVVNVDGSPVIGYDNLKIACSNMVKADHVLTNSIYPQKIYAEGFEVQITADLFFEDTTQYQKFLNAQTAHFNIVITSGQVIGGTVKYSLTLDLPLVYYKAAPIYIPSNGPLKIPFTGLAQYSFGSTYTLQAVLVNSVATQY